MTLQDVITEFEKQNIEFKTDRYKVDKDRFLVGPYWYTYEVLDEYICDVENNEFHHISKGERDNGRIRAIYETEAECVAEALYKISIQRVDNKEKLKKLCYRATIDAFSEFINKYSDITGIKYVQHKCANDYFNKIGTCGLVRTDDGKSWEFVLQGFPASGDRPNQYFVEIVSIGLYFAARLAKDYFKKNIIGDNNNE